MLNKRILAIVLCLMMVLGCGVAEKSDVAWQLAVDEIVVSYDGTKVSMNPSAEVMFGREGDGFWMQAALLLGGESIAAVQSEMNSEFIQGSVDGANDYLIIDGTDTFLQQYGVDGKELLDELDDLLEELDEFDLGDLGELNAIPGLKVKPLSPNSLRVTAEQDGVSVSFRVAWNRLDGGKPFDLSAKNPCRYTYREMYPGDGTDIPDALNAALNALMLDSSVQEAVALFGEPVLDM